VKTSFGYHLIEALSPKRPQKVTPLDKVRVSIRTTLLEERKQTLVTEWAEKIRDEYKGKISYAPGFEPPEVPEETDTETTETATD
jgi:parvulin-like peptidyl-prolyl isomerase